MTHKNWVTWLALGTMGVSLVLVGLNLAQQSKINKATMREEKQVQLLQTAVKNRQKVADEAYLAQAAKEDSQRGARAKQLLAVGEAEQATKNFFKITTTYSSQAEWLARPEKVKELVTDNVLKNQGLFNDGKDSDGHSAIETLKLSSSYVGSSFSGGILNDDGELGGNVEVQYRTQMGENPPTTVTDLYAVKYDIHQHKLTEVSRLGVLKATSEELGE